MVETAARVALLVALVICAVVDLRERRIPDIVLLPAFALVAGLWLLALFQGSGPWQLVERLCTAAGALAVFTLVRLASCGRLGSGDAKLAALIGFVLGVRGWLLALLIASAAGTVAAVALIAAGRLRRSDPIPFAPFLALGAAGALLAEPLVARTLAAAVAG